MDQVVDAAAAVEVVVATGSATNVVSLVTFPETAPVEAALVEAAAVADLTLVHATTAEGLVTFLEIAPKDVVVMVVDEEVEDREM